MNQRLALRQQIPTDEAQLTRPLLGMMEEYKLDFHATFRSLSSFRPSLLEPASSQSLDKFVASLLSLAPQADLAKATLDWRNWLEKYAQRILSEASEWTGDMDLEREKAAKGANPRFVLRQWVLEEVIQKVDNDAATGKMILGKVLKVECCTRNISYVADSVVDGL
jgi:serine/tyrosine/threonine adenylyltransferase